MTPTYDIAIIGGGLGGLTLAIQAAKAGYNVILLEKENYPFHKVCGEYISLESWDYLERCGMPLSSWQLPQIKQLQISNNKGKAYDFELPLGGFGVSRFTLDNALYAAAIYAGVTVHTNTKVNDVRFNQDWFTLKTDHFTTLAKVAVGAFGKRSNLDVKWKRPFVQQRPNKLNNFIGVKYHIRYAHPANTIALHNFSNGYCGISAIEEDKCCLCYLTTAKNLADSNHSIALMEQRILSRNPQLGKIFSEAEFIYDHPLTISNISFDKKQPVQDHVLFAGDAAGMITPLCGNGMSMAMHGGLLALVQIERYLNKKMDRAEMENAYGKSWQQHFAQRTATGRLVQQFFGGASIAIVLPILQKSPWLSRKVIEQTHGRAF